jgi:hypothetical protein
MTTTQRPAGGEADATRPPSPDSSSSSPSDDDERKRATHGSHDHPLMPSEVSDHVGWFDKFAGGASHLASRAPFFAFCVLLVLIWAPTYFIFKDVDTWQLIINTMTTIVTFLMVALLQNSQYRTDEATQHKLNALADGLADLMTYVAHNPAGGSADEEHDNEGNTDEKLKQDLIELRRAVGLEDHESTS